MPTYSYRCPDCGQVFDRFHSMSCTDPQGCPNCGAEGKKLMSASSVIFKGSGFYSTDYRDSGYLEAKKQDSKKTETSSDNKTEKTPVETKSEPVKKSEENKKDSPKPEPASTKAA